MTTLPLEQRSTRTYEQATKVARKLQTDLLNLVDEILLASWDDAGAASDSVREIENYLLELETSASKGVPPTVVNLLDVLNKVCELAEYSYRLRVDCVRIPGSFDDEG